MKGTKFKFLTFIAVAALVASFGYNLIKHSQAANADINGDGTVNISDLSILATNFGLTGRTFAQGDINGDGTVNILDLSVLASNWGSGGASTGYRDAVMADNPVAYWRFANTNSETGSHNGSLRGSPPPQLGQAGPFAGSQSIKFDGILRDNSTTGGFLANSLARLSSSTWSNGFTLEAWAKTTTDIPEQHVMTWSDSAGNAGPGILYDDPDNVWKFRDGSISLSMPGTVNLNTWYYLVAAVDGSGNGKLYVNGNQVLSWNSSVKPEAASSSLFTVGADYDGPNTTVDTPFNGWIAEAAVYSHPLTQTRIQAHFVAR